ncbi:unnamed protein product [Leptosia nina]|uniref:6-phosphofructo-2-kinase domain-containing protein n=1 Tax=Leptosia nina TaxID=320188 RepID=A0AAV1K269_9NEOP
MFVLPCAIRIELACSPTALMPSTNLYDLQSTPRDDSVFSDSSVRCRTVAPTTTHFRQAPSSLPSAPRHSVFRIYTIRSPADNKAERRIHPRITTAKGPFSCWDGSLLMALLSIRGDWYLFFWLIYCKVYSAIIWLVGNHCRGDKARSVISAGVGGQSPGGLHRVRTRRKKPQQHRVKHTVALVRRPSLRKTIMAPGASPAHAMMEDKEKALHCALANVSLRTRRVSQFAPLLIALVGLPARGKSQLAHRLSRHLNWNGESTKVFDCSEYRRRHMALYGTHDIFRADNQQGIRHPPPERSRSRAGRCSLAEGRKRCCHLRWNEHNPRATQRAERLLSIRNGIQDSVHRMRLRRPGVAREKHN